MVCSGIFVSGNETMVDRAPLRSGWRPLARRLLFSLSALASVAMAAHAAEAKPPQIEIVADGKSAYTIVVPDGPDPRERVAQASRLLRDTLFEATGARLPVVKEGDLKSADLQTGAIFLGDTRAAREAGLPLEELKGWTYINKRIGRNIFLVGRDASAGIKDAETFEYLGTLKAVTAFLEDQVGVRFLLPGPDGIYVPTLKSLPLPERLELVKKPTFLYVTGRDPQDRVYAVANNYFGAQTAKLYGGHSHASAVPLSKYGKTHPEYFALINGKRTVNGRSNFTQLCLSNPEVQELLLKEMESQFRRGYDRVLLSQNDGQSSCRCDDCRAIHPDYTERLWIVHRKLAEEMGRRAPGKTVILLAYGPTDVGPKTFTKFPDNVVIMTARTLQSDFERWERHADEFVVYIYNWGSFHTTGYGPKRDPHFLAQQVRRFAANNVRGIYLCGGFENLGLEGPNYYAYGRLMGDPNLPVDDVVDEFTRMAYGRAYEPMRVFFRTLHTRMKDYSITSPTPPTGLLRDTVFRDVAPRFRDNVSGRFPSIEEAYNHFFAPEVVSVMQRSLDDAKKREPDPKVQSRIRLIGREWDYVKDLIDIFDRHRAYRERPSWQAFAEIEAAVRKRTERIDSWYDGAVYRPIDDWPDSFGRGGKQRLKSGGNFLAQFRNEPIAWDFAAIRKKGALPPVQPLSLAEEQVDLQDGRRR